MNSISLVLASALILASANAITITQNFSPGANIPDDTLTGIQFTENIIAPDSKIIDITVNLHIGAVDGSPAFLGDLYAYLKHADDLVSLLNRPGRRTGFSAGYDDDQILNVTFDAVSPNIHSYRVDDAIPLTSALTGHWSPNGRATHPLSVLDTDRPALGLEEFVGASANGDWTLFVSDLSSGGEHRLVSWGLDIRTASVPDSGIWMPLAGLLWAGLVFYRKAKE